MDHRNPLGAARFIHTAYALTHPLQFAWEHGERIHKLSKVWGASAKDTVGYLTEEAISVYANHPDTKQLTIAHIQNRMAQEIYTTLERKSATEFEFLAFCINKFECMPGLVMRPGVVEWAKRAQANKTSHRVSILSPKYPTLSDDDKLRSVLVIDEEDVHLTATISRLVETCNEYEVWLSCKTIEAYAQAVTAAIDSGSGLRIAPCSLNYESNTSKSFVRANRNGELKGDYTTVSVRIRDINPVGKLLLHWQ